MIDPDLAALGAHAPDFELADTTGRPVRLSQYAGKQHVVLVFTRSFQ